ncbi:MAG: SUMF1/EgtB/PvdO family nonheme iron enzyme, partial [Planctomycetes bacterium]|nr:SUMF1/EgtB/PvdO family nonheme iron enzyme [Planctomycetota bacterium]
MVPAEDLRMLYIIAAALVIAGPSPSESAPESPSESPYEKRSTWQATLFAAREALFRLEREDARGGAGFTPFASEVVRGGEEARRISVPVAGLEEVYLYVIGVPHPVRGAADWAEARLVARDGAETLLSALGSTGSTGSTESTGSTGSIESIDVIEGRHSIDATLESGLIGPLKVAGRKFERGLHVYVDSKVRVPLGGKHERLEAWIGVDDWVGPGGAVRFIVTDRHGAARQDLWRRLRLEFPGEGARREMGWELEDGILDAPWTPGDRAALASRYAAACRRVPPLEAVAKERALAVRDEEGLDEVRRLYYRSRGLDEALTRARKLDVEGLRLAIEDLIESFGDRYPGGPRWLERLSALEAALPAAIAVAERGELAGLEGAARLIADLEALRREALLANPLLDFDRLLLVKRRLHGDARAPADTGYGMGEHLGLPRQSSKSNPGIERPFDWENEVAVLSPGPDGELRALYRPESRRLITDVDLRFDAARLLFSMPGTHRRWHVFEVGAGGTGLRQLTPGDQPDVDYYDACYLPDGRIAFLSTAVFQGVPCNAGVIVGMLYLMEPDGSGIRQVCFEQDHDYCPTVLNDGRLLYLRWDYTDTPHVWNRILFAMNPDGTGQGEHYGSGSYWPNAVFYARPVPGHPSKLAGIVTGHHVGRVGELVVFDPAVGRRETAGVVQRIPGRGREVEPRIEDKLTEHSWPKFLHPYPLSERHFLVSAKPAPEALWGIYLVDVFDNMVLVREEEGCALLEPIPFRATPAPPVIPDRVRPERKDALVYIQDLYEGPGLDGVPRGAVKRLRLFTYHFGYRGLAGIDHRVGADGPWEVKRVLGTVPVEEDGSALFRVPAKTPISIQPLDSDGQALALMRSWMTAMPGETVACTGCHEGRNRAPPNRASAALRRRPTEIEPWRGPVRGFSFRREVQPVLDRWCVGCHGGAPGSASPDLRAEEGSYVVHEHGNPRGKTVRGARREDLVGKYAAIFEPSYVELRRHVRVGGLESDLHLLRPLEFHASTTELIQMLRKGHHGVRLDEEAWDRLITWIDLNAPCHGTWGELARISGSQRERRRALRRLYGGIDEDAEEDLGGLEAARVEPVLPEEPAPAAAARTVPVACAGWPFDAAEARRRQAEAGRLTRELDLGGGLKIELVKVPAGSFVMGDADGFDDEGPPAAVRIARPFWMSRLEVTNEQYARFDPTHESRFEHRSSWIFSEEYLGWPLNRPRQPVVRVSWDQAMAFCRWLSEKTGAKATLPSEAQWEYACGAGSAAPFSYGGLDADFSRHANLADASIRDLAYRGWRPKSPDLVPRDARFNDGALVTAEVGSYAPNAFGLHDLHGNAAEWTRSAYRPYP